MDYFYEIWMCFLELDSYNSLIDLFCIPLIIYFHGFGNSDSENWKHMCSMVVVVDMLLKKAVCGIHQKGTQIKNGTKQGKSETNLRTTALIFSNKGILYLISNFLLMKKTAFHQVITMLLQPLLFWLIQKWKIVWNGKRKKNVM